MKECIREPEILEAITAGRWPEGSDEELRSHTSMCSICSDAALVASALQSERGRQVQNARVPSAGLVWWRSELRARQDAARKAERPMSVMQAFAGACVIGVVIALLGGILPFVRHLFTLDNLSGFMNLPLVLVAAAIVLIAPVALYFVFSDK